MTERVNSFLMWARAARLLGAATVTLALGACAGDGGSRGPDPGLGGRRPGGGHPSRRCPGAAPPPAGASQRLPGEKGEGEKVEDSWLPNEACSCGRRQSGAPEGAISAAEIGAGTLPWAVAEVCASVRCTAGGIVAMAVPSRSAGPTDANTRTVLRMPPA